MRPAASPATGPPAARAIHQTNTTVAIPPSAIPSVTAVGSSPPEGRAKSAPT